MSSISTSVLVVVVCSVLSSSSAQRVSNLLETIAGRRGGGNFGGRNLAGNFGVFGEGPCPVVNTQQDFNVTKYLGQWYELERFTHIFELNVKCAKAEYGLNLDQTVAVVNSGEKDSVIRRRGRKPVYIEGVATTPDATKPAELKVSFSSFDMSGNSANYFVVETDYDNYAVVFSCSPLFRRNIQFAWILTRAQGVAPSNLDALKVNLAASGVDVANFNPVEQTDCQLEV